MSTANGHQTDNRYGHGHSHENTVPKGALRLAGLLVAFSLALTASVRLGWLDAYPTSSEVRQSIAAEPVASRSLTFIDADEGTVIARDAASGEDIASYVSGEGGFVRGVLRGLVRERRASGIGSEAPFDLTLWDDGSISLTDTATNRVIEVGAFGTDNRATFQALLEQ